MADKEQLFFELIRVAIGTQERLSRIPSASEWGKLYKMAEKQSLIGVCFSAIQRLGANSDDGFVRIGLSEMLYLTWMGMAATIQNRNENVNRQCVELQTKLKDLGYRSCVLKGQSAAKLYGSLSLLRQSGDIDIWVDAPRKEIMDMVQRIAPTTNVREHHLELRLFPDTEVEVHFWPAVIRHFRKNKNLQKWFDTKREDVFGKGEPTPEFHAVQMMAHMYHHLFDSGIGLRQVMDYYFVLQTLSDSPLKGEKFNEVSSAIERIGMVRFASAMMYVLQETMGLERQKMICEPNVKDGMFLLGEIMRGGNFGKYDTKKTRNTKNYLSSFVGGITRNFRYLRFNPLDWFWSPLWRLWYFGWRKANGYH